MQPDAKLSNDNNVNQHIADDLAIIRLVLDHQNAFAHAISTCRTPRLTPERADENAFEKPPVPVSAMPLLHALGCGESGSGASLHHQNALAHAGSTADNDREPETRPRSVRADVSPTGPAGGAVKVASALSFQASNRFRSRLSFQSSWACAWNSQKATSSN
jgi:hypothetical protein